MKRPRPPSAAVVTIAAGICWLGAAIGFGAALPSYSHLALPLSLLGASGVPHAIGFNLCGFVLPGLLLAWVALGLRDSLPAMAGGGLRIGAWLLLFSCLAFAAQGIFPLEIDRLDAAGSRRHVAAWILWWLTFAVASVLWATGAWRMPGLRPLATSAVVAAAAMLALVLLTPPAWGGAVPQRMAFAAWFGWWVFAARSVRRDRRGG